MIFTMLLIFIFALYQYSIWFISLYLHCSTMLNILLFFVIVFFSVNYDAIKPRKRCTWSGGYGKNYLFSNFTSAIRPKKEVEPKYVHYGLLNSYMRGGRDRKSTRLNSSHVAISYAVFCLKKKNHERCETVT